MPIQIQDVSKSFPVKRVLNGITASFPTGHVSVIVGKNGSGKSTLLNCVLGLLPFETGSIKVENNGLKYDLASESDNPIPLATRHKIGYIFQQKALWQHLTVINNLVHPLTKIRKLTPAQAQEKANDYFDAIKLKREHYNKYPNELSGGEQRKVAIARTLAMEPDLLFIDELEANLDHSALKRTLEILDRKFVSEQKTVVIVSHNLEMLEPFVPYVSILHEGQIIETGLGIDDLLSKKCKSPEIASVIKESVDGSTNKWFVVSRGLQAAVEISKNNLAEPDLSKLLTQIGETIFKLVHSYDPAGEHLLLIATKITTDSSSSDVRIRCAQKTNGFTLDGGEASKFSTLVKVAFEDGRFVHAFKEDYVDQLETNHGITLEKKVEARPHYSLIDWFFDEDGRGLFYQYTPRHKPIEGAYCIGIPPDRQHEKDSYYEFSKLTKNVYLIGCSIDGHVKGVISVDTDAENRWPDFMVQQLVLIGNMVAIAIQNHELALSASSTPSGNAERRTQERRNEPGSIHPLE